MKDAIGAAVAGDVKAIGWIASDRPSAPVESFVVGSEAVLNVLYQLQRSEISDADAQQWASFIRRGYVAVPNTGLVKPVSIEYEQNCELEIADAISRLDELGDIVDGVLSEEELAALISTIEAARHDAR